MQIQGPHSRLVAVLYRDARRGRRSTPIALSRRLGCTPAELHRLLAELDALGWVDARRLRLTLPGLALAVATRRPRRRLVQLAA
jgi:DNA-binding IclR family transcriptional regulator